MRSAEASGLLETKSGDTIAAPMLRWLWSLAQGQGVSEPELEQTSGISPAEMKHSGMRASGTQAQRVLQLLERVRGSPVVVPLQLSEIVAEYPAAVGAWLTAPTPRAAIHSYLQTVPLLDERIRLELQAGGMPLKVCLQDGRTASPEPLRVVGTLLPLTLVLHHHGICVGERCAWTLLTPFPCRMPAELAKSLGGEVEVARGAVALLVWSRSLDEASPLSDPFRHRIFTNSVHEALADLAERRRSSVQIEQALRHLLTTVPTVASTRHVVQRVCRQLAVSRWTLNRRLRSEGLTFSRLWTRIRIEEAQRLLSQTALPVGEIGERLRFASSASFTRFFRLETGLAPSQFRAARPSKPA